MNDDAALKKGTAELLVLAQLEGQPRHGYEIAQQIAARAEGGVTFQAASLYPVLYRLEQRGLITGRWVEKAGQRRRRFYRLTREGRRVLAQRRQSWSAFMHAVKQAAGLDYA
jgi:transcriptional regulator